MQSSLTGSRKPSFRYTSVTATGVSLGALPRVQKATGSLECSQQASIRSSGSMSRAVADGAATDRIKIEYVLDEGLASERSWPLGVFLSASPVTNYSSKVATSTVDIYDGLVILQEDAIPEPIHLPVGTVITTEVANQLRLAGITRMAISESPKTLRTAMTFKVGTTRLQVINALLEAADYFAVWADGDGVMRVQPYVEPQDRVAEWHFAPGADSVFLDDVEVEDDIYGVPNRVIGVSRTTGEEPPLTSVAEIDDPDSPYHYSKLGRWRTEVLEDVDVATQADLDAKVQRRLREASQVSRKVTLRHGWLPFTINSVVTLDLFGIRGRFVVVNQNIPLDPKELATSTLREVSAT